MRILLLAIAWLCVGLGIIGIFLPLLPTTPFMILAAAIFARTSPRFEKWLMEHPRYGQPLIDWRREGAISRRAKILSVSLMAASFAVMWFFGPPMPAVKIGVALTLVCSGLFVVTRPEPRAKNTPEN